MTSAYLNPILVFTGLLATHTKQRSALYIIADVGAIFNRFGVICCCFLSFAFAEPIRNVALMATVFPTLITVNRYDLSAVLTGDLVVGFPFHLVEMLIPPLIAAFVAAESLRLPSCVLLDRLAAVLANRNDGGYLRHRLSRRLFLLVLSFLPLRLILRRMEFRECVVLNLAVYQMHFCRTVFHDYDSVNNQRNVRFIRLQFPDVS